MDIEQSLTIKQGVEPTDKEAEEILVQMTGIVELEEKQMAFAIQNKPTFDKLKVAGRITYHCLTACLSLSLHSARQTKQIKHSMLI
jgi:hypothetical protein